MCVKTSGIVLSRIEGGGGGECAGVYVCVSGEEGGGGVLFLVSQIGFIR